MKLLIILLSVPAFAQLATDPEIFIDNSIGSDPPSASGAPSSFGPFSALATCNTGGVATTVINWPANPLAGVPTNGSALLWMATAAGRRWSKITARAAGTVTVEDTFNIPGGTPVDCAVGGRIASLTPSRLFVDAKSGWYYSIVATGSDYSMAAALAGPTTITAGRRAVIRGSGGRPNLVWTADVQGFGNASGVQSWTRVYFENLNFSNTAGTHANSVAIVGLTGMEFFVIRGCTFAGFRSVAPATSGQGGLIYDNDATTSTNGAFGIVTNESHLFIGNYAHNNTSGGFGQGNSLGRQFLLYNISANNAGIGYGVNGQAPLFHNLAYGNTGGTSDGLINTNAASGGTSVIIGNLSSNNGRNGLNANQIGSTGLGLRNVNSYFSNAGGDYSVNATPGPLDVTGASPGYVNPAATDWDLGTPLVSRGWPPKTLAAGLNSTTFTGTEPGPSQRLGAGGNFAY